MALGLQWMWLREGLRNLIRLCLCHSLCFYHCLLLALLRQLLLVLGLLGQVLLVLVVEEQQLLLLVLVLVVLLLGLLLVVILRLGDQLQGHRGLLLWLCLLLRPGLGRRF